MKRSKKVIPQDTEPNLNVHKLFGRRPGRVVNVSCTFNLRLVYITPSKDAFAEMSALIPVLVVLI